jgi:hypothetical protein
MCRHSFGREIISSALLIPASNGRDFSRLKARSSTYSSWPNAMAEDVALLGAAVNARKLGAEAAVGEDTPSAVRVEVPLAEALLPIRLEIGVIGRAIRCIARRGIVRQRGHDLICGHAHWHRRRGRGLRHDRRSRQCACACCPGVSRTTERPWLPSYRAPRTERMPPSRRARGDSIGDEAYSGSWCTFVADGHDLGLRFL